MDSREEIIIRVQICDHHRTSAGVMRSAADVL